MKIIKQIVNGLAWGVHLMLLWESPTYFLLNCLSPISPVPFDDDDDE